MRVRIVLALVAAAAVLIGDIRPSAAAGEGAAVVTCTADFPHVPALTWTSGGTCQGSAVLAVAGIDTRYMVPFTLNGAGQFNAWFDYHEPCVAPGQPVVLSFANGWFRIDNVPATYSGYNMPATVYGQFSWNRIGLHPVITLSNVVVAFFNNSYFLPPGVGVGTASFTGGGNFNPATHGVCGAGGPLTIGVAIAADVALP